MRHLLRILAVCSQIIAARRTASALMSDQMRVWPEPGRPDGCECAFPSNLDHTCEEPEKPPRVEPIYPRWQVLPDTPMGPDLLLDGQGLEWHVVSGCVCKQFGMKTLACPEHGLDR